MYSPTTLKRLIRTRAAKPRYSGTFDGAGTPAGMPFSGPAELSSRSDGENASGASRIHGRLRSALASFPARSLLGLIWLYRHSLSPALPVICGPGCGCRFHPTCGAYAADAVRAHGAIRGSWLAIRRLLKCHPWHPGGVDPVPACRPVARRVAAWRRPVPAHILVASNLCESGGPCESAVQPGSGRA